MSSFDIMSYLQNISKICIPFLYLAIFRYYAHEKVSNPAILRINIPYHYMIRKGINFAGLSKIFSRQEHFSGKLQFLNMRKHLCLLY